MITDLDYLDVFEYQFEPLAKFSVQQSDHLTGLTAIATSNGILILKLHPDWDKQSINDIHYIKYFIAPSTYMLVDHLDLDIAAFIFELPTDHLFRALLQPSLTGSLDNIKKTTFHTTSCSISPPIVGDESIIAAITDVGALDLYIRVSYVSGITKYVHLGNVNSLHIEKFKYKWKNVGYLRAELRQEDACHRISMHAAKVVCWTHIMEQPLNIHRQKDKIYVMEYCCLIVAHHDGNIVFWQRNKVSMVDYDNTSLSFMYDFDSKLKDITALHWHPIGENSGLLIIGDSNGTVKIVPMIKLVQNYVEKGIDVVLIKPTEIPVDYIYSEVKDNHLIVYVVQQAHLIMFVVTKEVDIIQTMEYNCSNLNITGFHKTLHNSIVLSCLTGAMVELKTSVVDMKLEMETRPIYIDIDWNKHVMLGFFLSKNNAILSILTHHQGFNFKGPLKMKVWNFSINCNQCFSKFMDLDRICEGFDFLEVMKIRFLQKQELPCNQLPPDINYDKESLANLKKYLFIAKVSESIFDEIDTITAYNVKKSDEVLNMIYIQFAIHLLGEIVEELKTDGAVSEYKREVASVCYGHLKDAVMSDFLHEHNLKDNYVDAIMGLFQNCEELSIEENILCKICEEPITGMSCSPMHMDARCSLSLVQIEHSKYKCMICEKYVAEGAFAFNRDLCCPLCDSPLEVIFGYTDLPYIREECTTSDCMFS